MSAMTVVPKGRELHGQMILLVLVISVAIGALAVWLRQQFRRNPERLIFKSRAVSAVAIGVAALLALAVLMGVIG